MKGYNFWFIQQVRYGVYGQGLQTVDHLRLKEQLHANIDQSAARLKK